MASTYPAQLINAKDIGKIEPGFKANLVVFTYDYRVKYSVLEGDIFNDR
jgi:N-acetylglucosamine-6-phosphate deacetylase